MINFLNGRKSSLSLNFISANAEPDGKRLAPAGAIQSLTGVGASGYGGPCPAVGHGFHKYTITVRALDTDKLRPDKSTIPVLVGFNLNGHILGKASLTMYYEI